jgi:hypothetical protein
MMTDGWTHSARENLFWSERVKETTIWQRIATMLKLRPNWSNRTAALRPVVILCFITLCYSHYQRVSRQPTFSVFDYCPFTRTFSSQGDAGIRGMLPSVTTLPSRSIRNQRGNRDPIFATVRLYRILQLAIFDCCPAIRPVDARNQFITPSAPTLTIRSTRNQRGNCNPICLILVLAILLLAGIRNCTSQLCIFF